MLKIYIKYTVVVDVIRYIAHNASSRDSDRTFAALITEEVGIDALNEIEEGFNCVGQLIVVEGCGFEKDHINEAFLTSNPKNNTTASTNNCITTVPSVDSAQSIAESCIVATD